MRDGFIRAAAAVPKVRVADVDHNTDEVISLYREAAEAGASVIVFPELVLTSYTCQDLFLQGSLLRKAFEGLKKILDATEGEYSLLFVGLPLMHCGKLYNTAAAISNGKLLGIIPKRNIPNYSEYYEARHFAPGPETVTAAHVLGQDVPFGANLLFEGYTEGMPEPLIVGAEICEDLWTADTPSTKAVSAGANVVVNLSASVEITGRDAYRQDLVRMTSGRLVAGYVYASAGEGESSQDLVFSGSRMIAENGRLLAHSGSFTTGITYAEIDLDRIAAERRRITTFRSCPSDAFTIIPFEPQFRELELKRHFDARPFVPSGEADRAQRCEEVLTLQALGLKKRLEHIRAQKSVIGISGGLDSTLALLVTAKAFDLLGLDRKGIEAVTMPAFGTTDRTLNNARALMEALGCSVREINIRRAVEQHFSDIGHDPSVTDVTYENSQARERTQVLMDLANQSGGIVIGTGDLSELALGWATYNGDHMSMYGVNSSVPKTLVRHLVGWYADTCGSKELGDVLRDVLDTPVSPELLPPKEGDIAQKTEDLVGPYELHDFFLYYMMRFGFAPRKIFRIAEKTFRGQFDKETILKWLRTFYWRFFSQQYKRSCVPDGPKVGSVALSPRGDLRMPSDAVCALWQEDLEKL